MASRRPWCPCAEPTLAQRRCTSQMHVHEICRGVRQQDRRIGCRTSLHGAGCDVKKHRSAHSEVPESTYARAYVACTYDMQLELARAVRDRHTPVRANSSVGRADHHHPRHRRGVGGVTAGRRRREHPRRARPGPQRSLPRVPVPDHRLTGVALPALVHRRRAAPDALDPSELIPPALPRAVDFGRCRGRRGGPRRWLRARRVGGARYRRAGDRADAGADRAGGGAAARPADLRHRRGRPDWADDPIGARMNGPPEHVVSRRAGKAD